MPPRRKFHVPPSGSGSIIKKTLSNGKPVTKALFRQMLAEEMRVIQDELGEHRFSSGRFNDAARLMEQITTSDDLIDFLTLPGYRFLA